MWCEKMFKIKRSISNIVIICTLLFVGLTFVIASMIYVSSLEAILGVTIIFWTSIFFYILPAKHIPLILFNKSVQSSTNNVERILSEFDLTEKGVYLSPKILDNLESSLIFVPKSPNVSLPLKVYEDFQRLFPENKEGVLLTPPGYALSMLFEKELGSNLIKISLQDLPIILPKLLVEKLELAQKLEVLVNENIVKMQITGNIFSDICKETDKNLHSHIQIGCLLSSALACVLAKVTGKSITIQNETRGNEDNILYLEFLILNE
jgi:hypothetical protein